MRTFKIFLGLLFLSATATVFAQNSCNAIAQACKKAGYYHGGSSVHKGLVANCMLPVVNKKPIISLSDFSDRDLEECKAFLMSVFAQGKISLN